MQISCGILILNQFGEILMGHSNGNNFYDLPKGKLEEGEEHIDCAIRECIEETSLRFEKGELLTLGEFAYNKTKRISLFLKKVKKEDINFEELKCTSMFEHYYTKKLIPEFDSFAWIHYSTIDENCAKSMSILLSKVIADIDM